MKELWNFLVWLVRQFRGVKVNSGEQVCPRLDLFDADGNDPAKSGEPAKYGIMVFLFEGKPHPTTKFESHQFGNAIVEYACKERYISGRERKRFRNVIASSGMPWEATFNDRSFTTMAMINRAAREAGV